jgi:tRNA (guanine-N7-)-methyltransferase
VIVILSASPPQKLSSWTLPWPTDWAAHFGVERPLILEIGFGYAHYLAHLATTHPDCNIIGIEIANKCLVAGEEMIRKRGLTNVCVIHSTAETALHHLFTPASLTEVYINFPDPWFKTRHAGRRLMQRDTLDALVNRLRPGGLLWLATDIIEYAEMSAALLAETLGLTNRLESPWVYQMPGRVLTKYERKAGQEGRPCHYFSYQRNDQPSPPVPVIEELPMPHIVLRSPLSLDAVLTQFERTEHRVGENIISLMAAYRGRHSLLFEVFIKEPTIEQHVAFLLNQHPGDAGEFTLQLGTLGHPRPTLGLHQAAGLLGDWLIRLHPAAVTLNRKLNPVAEASLKQMAGG